MVKIAMAGASGQVAREITDALLATKKHDLILLTRGVRGLISLPLPPTDSPQPPPAHTHSPRTTWVQTDYTSVTQLTALLEGVHTVLSFVTSQTDPENISQINLIDAAVKAGVKRFAPSEWATSSFEHMPWYANKGQVRDYLRKINTPTKILQYTLFQPGLFTNYLAHPHPTSTHITSFQTQFDFQLHRAIIREDGLDDVLTLTTARDLANVVTLALDFPGEWPEVGGIKGQDITVGEIVKLGEKLRGHPFNIQTISRTNPSSSLSALTWIPKVDHAAIPTDQAEKLAGMFLTGMVLGIGAGALRVGDEWNRLLPHYEFESAEGFLGRAWVGRP